MSTRNATNKKSLGDESIIVAFEAAIDYPQQGEAVMPGHYAIRISGTPETEVEACVNGGPWQTCRSGAGFYWLDWWAEPGYARISARFKATDNDWKKSKERRVMVGNPAQN